jgi:hypothetical protein
MSTNGSAFKPVQVQHTTMQTSVHEFHLCTAVNSTTQLLALLLATVLTSGS